MARTAQDWPKLLPINQIIERGTMTEATDDDAEALRSRAAALRGRAAVLRGSATDIEALRARLPR
ncbi:MAG: hypothetical protein AAF965_12945 [Pseudomonadota bacterium]